jgi:regulator of sirC expression with transglutaminase-like and TPR domain
MDADPIATFAALVQADQFERLDIAVGLIGAAFDRRADLDVLDARLTALAGRVEPTFESVAGGLFATGLLRGNTDDYADPRNSFLHEVLRRRVGLPISLSIVAIEVGRRRGVTITGVGLPGHFVVGDGSGERFADPFHGGVVHDREGMASAWRRITRSPAPLEPAMLLPTPPRAIAMRVLNNLRSTLEQRDDEQRLPILARLRAPFPEWRGEHAGQRRWLRGWN